MEHEPPVCQHETPTGNVGPMIRPRWTGSDEQKALADKAAAAFRAVDEREEQAWKDLVEAVDAGVPIMWLADQIGRSRQTVHRKLKKMGRGNPTT